jgi:hypothetical protein
MLRGKDRQAVLPPQHATDQASCPTWTQPAWEGRDREGKRVTLWAHEWVNPHPEKQIASVRLEYSGGKSDEAVVLLALSALG